MGGCIFISDSDDGFRPIAEWIKQFTIDEVTHIDCANRLMILDIVHLIEIFPAVCFLSHEETRSRTMLPLRLGERGCAAGGYFLRYLLPGPATRPPFPPQLLPRSFRLRFSASEMRPRS